MSKADEARAYLHAIVMPLTKSPDAIKITNHVDENGLGIVLNVVASDSDLAFLIGKQGVTARSIRRLVKNWGDINSARILLHIGNPIQQHHDF